MKVITRTLPSNVSQVKIVALSDLHIGDPQCNMDKIKKALVEIASAKDTYVIFNGDLMNTALKSSKSDVYVEQLTPTDQILMLCDLLEPIKDKILVIHPGNHEARILKEDGVDVIKLVAKQLGILDRYSAGWWYLFLSFGNNRKFRNANNTVRPFTYTITGVHGYGGGRKIGGKANTLVEMSDKVIADLYICGHLHQALLTKNSIFVPNHQNKTLSQVEKHYLMTSSFLEYSNSYGELMGFNPGTIGMQYAILDGRKKRITLTM